MKSNNRLLAALALVATTSVIAIPIHQEVEASTTIKDFKDVPKSNPNYEIIQEMVGKGVISGYEDGTFRPNNKITRKHVATLMNRALKLEKVATFKQPIDLPTTHPYYEDIKFMIESGLLKVNPKGYIFPDRELTRGEMAQILAKGFSLDIYEKKHPFKDVSSWNTSYVAALYNSGVTTGYEDQTFREAESVTRQQYTVFMYRAMDYVKVMDLSTLTDEEIYSMSNRQLINYILPYQYNLHEYLPEGETDVTYNYYRWRDEYNSYTRHFSEYNFSGLNFMSEYGIEHRVAGDISELIQGLSQNVFGLSAKETIDLINQTFLEGNFVKTHDVPTAKKDFAMFYNYGAGNMFIRVGDSKSLSEEHK